MSNLIRAADARRAILKADPKLAFCIDSIPAVDAVEVVRCKDCKHCTEIGLPRCRRTGRNMIDDDFCSRGERRTNG